MKNCEFCTELSSFSLSRIGEIYKDENIKNRIVAESNNFIVMPTIAPIVPYSYLVLPKEHYETYAQIPSNYYNELLALIENVRNKLDRNVILFEHGAKSCTNSGCGVYHAHIHIVPIVSDFNHNCLVGQNSSGVKDFYELMEILKNNSNYIFYRDNKSDLFYNTSNIQNSDLFVSQYLRRWLQKTQHINKNWDWKSCNIVEKEVLNAIEYML
ncbi:conserved hypothetical protein [Prosthecochloris aestuarii DSM 271]|uniref:HIT domain-containing protein n=1 Tax=Prosthecochloris aestuarii (strain DSM 271 / SK 413) TaxID=290512 RepID=B4S637_PROA2|nr:HIT domain-containing protein [Prosthecochloris aestuarii]ACF45688.1 conserved hypothetical protein [Prosthecochloris aestuarii DSM 271]